MLLYQKTGYFEAKKEQFMKKIDDFKKIYFDIIPNIWEICSKYKNHDFTEENESSICKAMTDEFQSASNKYFATDKKATKLFNAITVAILDFIFFKEEDNNGTHND